MVDEMIATPNWSLLSMPECISPIIITGPYTSGKGVLASLLDSHEIFAIPMWHDMLISTFFDFTNYYQKHNTTLKWLDNDDRIIQLRKFLSNVDYPTLEQFALQKKIVFPISAENYEIFEFNFDYYCHTKEFFESVYKLLPEEITTRNLFNLFTQSFINNFKDLSQKNYKYFVSVIEPGFYNFKELISQFPDIKIIYINRDWLIPLCSRYFYHNFNPFCVFEDNRIHDIIRVEKEAPFYQKKYPENFKIIEFNNLINNTTTTMQEIIKFISFQWNDIYSQPTFLTKTIKSKQLISEIIDTKDNTKIPAKTIKKLESEYKRKKSIIMTIENNKYEIKLEKHIQCLKNSLKIKTCFKEVCSILFYLFAIFISKIKREGAND